MNLSQQPLVFIDVETTGLDSDYCAILEVAAIRRLPSGVTDRIFFSNVRPHPDATIEPQALQINGHSSARWVSFPPAVQVLTDLASVLTGGLLVGHNIAFDRAFLRRAFLRDVPVAVSCLGKYSLDTASMAWPLVVSGKIQKLGLADVCTYFGISNEGAHGALRDAERCRDVYTRLSALWT